MAKIGKEKERTLTAVQAAMEVAGDYDIGFIEGFARGRLSKVADGRQAAEEAEEAEEVKAG